jgi:hypothetical protein
MEVTETTNWSTLLAPAPMGIAVLSQLLIFTSHVADFPINKIDKEKTPLIIHPNSFRTTLVQIANDAYNAFMKAHTNMEKIQLQVAQVPDNVKECVEIIKSGNKVAIDKLVPRRLEFIKQAADDGEKLSKEVCDAFDLLGKLIQQVLLAIAARGGAKEQEIQAAIDANMEEKKKRQSDYVERRKQLLQKEVEDNLRLKNKVQELLIEEQQRSQGFWESIFSSGEKERKIGNFLRMIEDAEKGLKNAKQDAAKDKEEMEKICDECIKSLANMKVDGEKNISLEEMVKTLKDGTKLLSDLQENWTGMTEYFISINSYIEKVMKKQQNMFVEDTKVAQENTSMINFIANSMKKSLESSIKSHRTAATYVKVSNSYIMGPLRSMHGMLALAPAEMEKAQEELVASCKRACEGIKIMCKEDREQQTNREMENALQSSDPVQSIQN